uniref:Uncharacterized protein n=1 Tax=Rhizophora mucronata TaxID=61149 RepID=A0A2P2PGS7_RHIMU
MLDTILLLSCHALFMPVVNNNSSVLLFSLIQEQ